MAICGTRLWDLPDVSFAPIINWIPNPISSASQGPPDDEARERALKIYRREVGRLDRALLDLKKLRQESERELLPIVILHYPPCAADLTPNELTKRFEAQGIRHVVFGHLHSLRDDLEVQPFGERDGVHYHLTSYDHLGGEPVLIDEI